MKKRFVITTWLLSFGILTIVLLNALGTKPFAKLTADEVMSAELYIVPPNSTVTITDSEDIAELTDILNEIVIYQKDDSGREYDGQLVQATITLKKGETHVIGAYSPFLFLNGTCYRTKYEPCQKLNSFGNRILNQH